MTSLQNPTRSRTDRAAARAAVLDAAPLLIIGGLIVAIDIGDPDGSRTAWLLLNVAFIAALAWAMIRSFRRGDEYQRTIQLEAMAVAFGVVLVALNIAGLLEASGIGDLRQSMQIILIGGVLTWLIVGTARSGRLR